MREESSTTERIIGRIASRQRGNVKRDQLLAAGVSSSAIGRRVDNGALIPTYRGVYRVGHVAASIEADYFAAVLGCGAGAVLSGSAAAHLYGLLRRRKPPPPEVTTRWERRIPALTTCRSKLDPRDTTLHRGIAITTVPRTLVDIASVLLIDELAVACHEANVRYRVTPEGVETSLGRKAHAPGAANLRRVLRGDVNVSLSTLERRFISLINEEGLPRPMTNTPASGRYVDCRWPNRRLTVELDSYEFHNSRYAWERDRRREREAYARGDRFRRYTWGDVVEDPRLMLRELNELLDPGRRAH